MTAVRILVLSLMLSAPMAIACEGKDCKGHSSEKAKKCNCAKKKHECKDCDGTKKESAAPAPKAN